jgi:hypothetical protein
MITIPFDKISKTGKKIIDVVKQGRFELDLFGKNVKEFQYNGKFWARKDLLPSISKFFAKNKNFINDIEEDYTDSIAKSYKIVKGLVNDKKSLEAWFLDGLQNVDKEEIIIAKEDAPPKNTHEKDRYEWFFKTQGNTRPTAFMTRETFIQNWIVDNKKIKKNYLFQPERVNDFISGSLIRGFLKTGYKSLLEASIHFIPSLNDEMVAAIKENVDERREGIFDNWMNVRRMACPEDLSVKKIEVKMKFVSGGDMLPTAAIPPCVASYKNVDELSLDQFDTIPSIIGFPNLKPVKKLHVSCHDTDLNDDNKENKESFSNLGFFENATDLHFSGCKHLEKTFETIEPARVKRLEVYGDGVPVRVQFPSLEHLELTSIDNLSSNEQESNEWLLPELESLEISHVDSWIDMITPKLKVLKATSFSGNVIFPPFP